MALPKKVYTYGPNGNITGYNQGEKFFAYDPNTGTYTLDASTGKTVKEILEGIISESEKESKVAGEALLALQAVRGLGELLDLSRKGVI